MTINIKPLRNQEQIAEDLIMQILDRLDERYGPRGESPLDYHNRSHSENVLSAITAIAEELIKEHHLQPQKLIIARISAAGHDLIQGQQGGANERESGREAAELMTKSGGFSEKEIEEVQEVINATVVKIENYKIIYSPGDNLLSQALADADLSTFGMPPSLFWESALNHAKEYYKKKRLNPEELQEYIKYEIELLKNHHFYTNAAERLFPHKQANIVWLKMQLQAMS
jgi:predicted metal-dependent HD superfamily phosphohydrolase